MALTQNTLYEEHVMNNTNITDSPDEWQTPFEDLPKDEQFAIKVSVSALLDKFNKARGEIDLPPIPIPDDLPIPIPDNLPMRWPKGYAGEIAKAIYRASYLPQQEIAIVTTLALLSGIAGRAYRTPTGATLSQYYLLVAPTGSGKDAIHKLIPQVLRTININQAERFAVAERFVSAPALHRRILEQPGFLSLHPEFGRRLAIIASPRAMGGHDQQFADKLIEAYEKEFMEGITRSKKEDCVQGVEWPCLSFLGETTPQTFYSSLTTTMMENGFFSRFLTMQVTSERPRSNRNAKLNLEGYALDALQPLISEAIRINSAPSLTPTKVTYLYPSVEKLFLDFEEECREKINDYNRVDNIYGAAVWNRAHLKALKIASDLAVIDDCYTPAINGDDVFWAIYLVRRDAQTFMEKVSSGDIGDGDDVREKKVIEICLKVLQGKIKDKNPRLRKDGVVTRRVLQSNTSGLVPFKNHPLKASRALDETIRSMLSTGHLMLIEKHTAVEVYGELSVCYRVTDDDHI
jgi:hypothetical protein